MIALWASRHPAAAAARAGLTPLALLYESARRTRVAAYRVGLKSRDRLPRPSVGVGGLQVGGAGKSPVASWVAGWLADRGVRPAILLRGYGGDEGPMHRALEPRAVVVEHADRRLGAERAVTAGAEVLVLDDHAQYLPVRADHTFLLFDASALRGPLAPLPAGPWRQPWDSGEADVLVLTRKFGSEGAAAARALLRRAYPRRPVAQAALDIAGWQPLGQGPVLSNAELSGATLLPVCGVADPRPFLAHARSVGDVPRVFAFRDHAAYGLRRVHRLAKAAESSRVDYVVTTAKDVVKLGAMWPPDAPPVLVAQLAVRWEAGEADVTGVLDACLEAHGAPSATSPLQAAAVSAAGTA